MKSAKLRHPAEVVREITWRTSSGAETTDYESILKTRVGITSVSGKEYIEGGAETMETTVKIVMRIHPSSNRVLMGDIIKANNRQYKIISPLEFDTMRSLQIMCKELV